MARTRAKNPGRAAGSEDEKSPLGGGGLGRLREKEPGPAGGESVC